MTPDQPRRYRVGIDVGGTNTDAVLILESDDPSATDHGIKSFHKSLTTTKVTDGIETVLRHVLVAGGVRANEIAVVSIGTTHFLNAVIEQDTSRLDPVAVLRLSSSYTRSIPPFCDFPPALADVMYGYHAFCEGGCNIDGSQIAAIDENEIRNQARHIKQLGLKRIVLTAVYSPVDTHFQQEEQAKSFILEIIPDATVVCSRDLGSVGILERENAAILNASILGYAQQTIRDFNQVMTRLALNCPLFLTQNDGTLISSASAAQVPIKTFSSGATNSMRGAAYLSRLSHAGKNVVVLDIGGTTCDAGILMPSGYPREAAAYTTLAGVRVNFPMPSLISIGLGGGSIVRKLSPSKIEIGPDSVGHDFVNASRIFGGDVLTTSDIAVATGNLSLGNASLVSDLDETTINAAQTEIGRLLSNVVEQIKTSPEPAIVLLVGGGSIIAPESIVGAGQVVRPPYHDVANAVGAAVAKVAGQIDLVEVLGENSLSEIVATCTKKARDNCISAGGSPETITVTDVCVVPVQYCVNSVRVSVKCVGHLSLNSYGTKVTDTDSLKDISTVDFARTKIVPNSMLQERSTYIDLVSYRPHIDGKRQWIISEIDLKLLALGCYVLGCAGGGSPYGEYLQLRNMLRAGHVFKVIEPGMVGKTDLVLWGGYMGSPAVSVERTSADEFLEATNELLSFLDNPQCSAVMGLEIGGGNGLQAFFVGSSKQLNLPCLDADWYGESYTSRNRLMSARMGRAFPTCYQTTLCVYKQGELTPAAISSGQGRAMLMTKADDDEIVDIALRAACTEMGSRVGMAVKPMSGAYVRDFAVTNTISLAWRIGRAIQNCQQTSTICHVAERIIDEVGGPEAAKKLFCGKIISVENKLFKGHNYGTITIEAAIDDLDSARTRPLKCDGLVRIPYKNESILVNYESPSGDKEILATVPDLICVLDANNGEALGVPEFRYGLRVIVLGITASPRWTDTPKGLALGGPAAFGHDVEYRPVGMYKQPRSVIEEFA